MQKFQNTLAPGCLLKGYRIEKVIGGGGFSLVYLATQLDIDEPVAIKEYLPANQAKRVENLRVEPLSDETASTYRQGIKRFFEEASALAKIDHPNIVRVTNFFRANNTVYMVMRYEFGKDLRWYIKRHSGQLSEKFIRTVFPPLLVGLRELHDNQLLHLDIKPANILLRAGGNPLLLDFGAALGSELANKFVGPNTLTMGFAPIEQHNKGHMGPWTDMYALGASMYACICGRAPPAANQRVVKDKYKSAVRAFSRRYSKQLLEAIDWCMEINQLERPQNVQELVDFLNQPPEIMRTRSVSAYMARLGLKLPWIKT